MTSRPVGERVWLGVLALGLAALAWFFWRHGDYYLKSLPEQALDPRHPELRSSGRVGLLFGLAGTTLIVLNLTYLLRRQMIQWRWLGALRSWMNFHVCSGLLGASCILLHSALSVRSALGLMAGLCLLIVVLTGLVGRYLYIRVPRSLEGKELQLEELRFEVARLRRHLADLGVDLQLEEGAEPARRRGLRQAFVTALRGDAALRAEYRRRRARLLAAPLEAPVRAQALRLLKQLFREQQWLRRYHDLRDLMASWRFLHRWLALVMLGTAAFHIGLALWYGDLRFPF